MWIIGPRSLLVHMLIEHGAAQLDHPLVRMAANTMLITSFLYSPFKPSRKGPAENEDRR